MMHLSSKKTGILPFFQRLSSHRLGTRQGMPLRHPANDADTSKPLALVKIGREVTFHNVPVSDQYGNPLRITEKM